MTMTTLRKSLALGLVAGSAGLAACGIGIQQEIELGQQYAAEINRQLPLVTDAQVHAYINQLGTLIQRQPGARDIPYTYYVVNSAEVNAFAVPGGHVYLNRGLIERTANLSELAGVLAHEIGHVEARHSVEMLERLQAAQAGLTVASILLGGPPGGVAAAAVDIGAAAYFSRHSREAEFEADAIAVQLTTGAGINPAGLVTFFRTLLDERERAPTRVEQWFATHPLTEERIANTRELIRQTPGAEAPGLVVTNEQYRAFRERVSQLPAPPTGFRD